ncbi:hypothetical protein [Tenacibaculum sp. UWU-22]|uniref:hypothetical protein n=1 Tax=Tenacibaculum sp. UWU-22 TaxID=3234187 RepID=UPI0034DB66C4
MRNLLVIILLIFGLYSISSCRKDFSTIPSFGQLQFSKDTVFLDTIFSNIGSATYNLKVYNNSNKAITIPTVKLKNGSQSYYRLNVDGIAGNTFENIDVLAHDSLYIFIETTINYNNVSNPLYVDKILFDNGNNEQEVNLVTLVQDAVFLYPDKDPITMKIDSLTLDGEPTNIQGRFLKNNELVFTKDKPYVVYGYIAVPKGKTMQVQAGTKIYFHNNSGLIIDKGATLKTNGTLEEKVVFEGDRLEHYFNNIAGQWGTIWMRPGSVNNQLKNTQIKNGIIGVLVDSISNATTPTLTLENTEIYNNATYGILGRNTHIKGKNVVIGNAGQASLACLMGGTYNFTHATFANYWNTGYRQLPTVLINNHFSYTNNNGETTTKAYDLTEASFTNCIIAGNNDVEFILDSAKGTEFNYSLKNCMIKFNDVNNTFTNNNELNFDNSNYENIILNGTTDFKNSRNNEFIIGQKSDAINHALPTSVNEDILGISRGEKPDIGAYQHINFE